MAYPTLYEKVLSRPFEVSRGSSTVTAEFIAVGSYDETDVYDSTIISTPTTYLGLYRKSVKASPMGGGNWNVSVEYAPLDPKDALTNDTSGTNDQKDSPSSSDAPLTIGFGFSTTGGTTHITQAITHISSTVRAPLVAPDWKKAIGVTLDGVEGCDIISPNSEFYREAKRAKVSLNYFRTLSKLTGSVNDAGFYGFAAGELLYLGCEGKGETGANWTLTHRFAFSPNKANIVISDTITVPVKKGWDYLWVDYIPDADSGSGRRVRLPTTANVEQVYEYKNFGALEIGT
jgi:hypothetical protein